VYSFPFIWPADGPITSFMSPEHPNGIDIGLEDSETMEVRAAAGGIVTEAGGSEEDALGISLVIDHGNGVTTTYGHLSELLVAPGDEVEIGGVIAIGGSTGISTGEHLHFEVRKDGETVDPLHVLPTEEGDTVTFAIDCATAPFSLPSGAQALLDFAAVLNDEETLIAVDAVPLSGGPALESTIEGRSQVLITSAINFHGPDGLDSYGLVVTVESSPEDHVVSCAFAVEQREVPTTFYVRTFTPTDDVVPGEGDVVAVTEEEQEPTPTPTPNPWAQSPDYQVSSPSDAGVQAPSYSGPSGAGAGVQSPNYGVPGPSATPSPSQ
jgi:pyruvate/2-oxoglutarate dehydrogenase complex dihydrolipoamide acyltransferase (E2) component